MEQEESIPKLDEAYYFRQLQAHQIENIIINLTKQEENDTSRLQALILSHYATITHSFDLLKDIHKDASALSETIVSSFTGKEDQLNESVIHEQSALFVDLDRSLALFEDTGDSRVVEVYENAFDRNRVEDAFSIIEEEIADAQMSKLMIDALLGKIKQDFMAQNKADRTIQLLEKAFQVLSLKQLEQEFPAKVTRSFLESLIEQLHQLESEQQESEKESLLSETAEPFQEFKRYVHYSEQQRRIEEMIRNLSFKDDAEVKELSDEIDTLIEKQMDLILEEQFSSFQNTDLLLQVIQKQAINEKLALRIEAHLTKEVNAQLLSRIDALMSLGKEVLNFSSMHQIKRTMLELEQFLLYDSKHLSKSAFFKAQLASIQLPSDSSILRVLGNKVKELICVATGQEMEKEENGEECLRLMNLLNFY